MAYNNKNSAVLYCLVFFFYLLLNVSGTSVPKHDMKPYRRIIYSSLTSLAPPSGVIRQPKRKNWLVNLFTTHPNYIWIDSYYIQDEDYPFIKPKPPLSDNRIEKGSSILFGQVVKIFKNMILGTMDYNRKRLYVPKWIDGLLQPKINDKEEE